MNGSLISEVALPHSMCGGGGDGPIGIPEPVPMEGRVAGGASMPPPATAAYTCPTARARRVASCGSAHNIDHGGKGDDGVEHVGSA